MTAKDGGAAWNRRKCKFYFTKKELKEIANSLYDEIHKSMGCGAFCRRRVFETLDWVQASQKALADYEAHGREGNGKSFTASAEHLAITMRIVKRQDRFAVHAVGLIRCSAIRRNSHATRNNGLNANRRY